MYKNANIMVLISFISAASRFKKIDFDLILI